MTFARPTKKSRTSRELKFLKPHDRSTAQSPFKGDSLPKPNPVLFERMHCLNERENNILVPYQWPTSSCLSSDESSDDLSTAEFLFGGGGRETETTSIASSTRDMLADGPTTRGLREMTQMPTGDPSVVTIPDFDSVEGIEEVDPISTEVSVPPRLKRKRFSTPNGETSVKVVSILSQTKPHFEQLPDQLTQAGPSKASVKHIEFKNKKPVRSQRSQRAQRVACFLSLQRLLSGLGLRWRRDQNERNDKPSSFGYRRRDCNTEYETDLAQ